MLSKSRSLASLCLSSFLMTASAVRGQISQAGNKPEPAATAADVQRVKLELDSVKSQLEEIKQLLLTQRATLPAGATRSPTLPPKFNVEMTLPFIPEQRMGSKSAPFVLVEFSDLQCPFCNDFAKRTLPVFIDRYVKSGKVLLLSVEFPLESHPEANKLSMASICAGKQSKYWQMREALMNMKAPSVDAAISAASASLGLDESALKSCASSSEVQRPLKTRVEQAKTAGVYSTPTFLLGKIEGNAVRGVSFVGDISPSEFSAKVETAMRQVTGGTNEQSKVDINIK